MGSQGNYEDGYSTATTATDHIIQLNRPEHFSKLYDKFSPLLFGFILNLNTNKETAEIILQQTFMIIWENREQYDPSKETLFTWLYRTTYLTYRNYCIANGTLPELPVKRTGI